MDEPHIPASSETSESEKGNIENVSNDVLAGDQLDKPMEVDDDFPSTSSGKGIVADQTFEYCSAKESEAKTGNEEAGIADETLSETTVADVTIPESDQTIEQINFDKQNESIDDTLNFTEKSINISQVDIDHQQDDSNDAFNALKRDEIDALHEESIKQEVKEEIKSDETPMETDEPIETSTKSPDDDSQIQIVEDTPNVDLTEDSTDTPETSETPIEKQSQQEEKEEVTTAEKSTGDDDDGDKIVEDIQESTTQTDVEVIAEKSPLAETNEISEDLRANEDIEDSVQSPVESSSVEKQPEEVENEAEDEEFETTNEGEGMDENVCLLGDAEENRELTDADKERVVQSQEISEEEESSEVSTSEKEPNEPTESAAQTDEIMEVDDAELPEIEKDVEEEPITELEEIEEPSIDQTVPLKENEIREIPESELADETCLNCENTTKCLYRLLEESGEIKFLCSYNCIKDHREDNPDKYTLTQKKVNIYEIPPAENSCSKCSETKSCKYHYRVTVSTTVTKEIQPPDEVAEGEEPPVPQEPITETVQSIESRYICDESCLREITEQNAEKYIVKEVQRRSTRVRETTKRLIPQEAEPEIPKIVARSDADVEAARVDRDESFIRRCTQCCLVINFGSKTIQWEALDFCNEKCLGQYQNLIGAACIQCNEVVSLASIGKLCVRFGFELKQFCTTKCLDEFKKTLKQCALCQRDLIGEENVVLAQVGEKKIYRDFCNQQCLNKYEFIINPSKKKQPPYVCSVCNHKKPVKIEVIIDGGNHCFCSNPCYSAFKFVNNVAPDQCDLCEKYFERKSNDAHTIYNGTESKIFCSQVCQNLFICKFRDIWQCIWCKVSKYNFDMIQCNFGNIRMCSLNCLSLSEVSLNALSQKRSKCAHCKLLKQPQYHLTMSDSTIRQFCTYQCAIGYQGQFRNADFSDVVPAGTAKRIKPSMAAIEQAKKATVPVIANVQSLSSGRRMRGPYNPILNRPRSPIPVPELTVQLERLSDLPTRVKIHGTGSGSSWTPISSTARATTPPTRVEHKTQVVTIPALPTQVSNKSTMCKAITLNKAIHAVPNTCEAECQTEDFLEKTIILPIPVPIYIPQPMYMYNMPTPIPVPIPLPIPVPVFIPTTRNSASGIMKEIKKIQDKMPTDPYEAELLMMAEMVAGDRKREQTDSDSEEENEMEYGEGIENNASFNEDLVQMAFKMASGNDFDDPPVDLENEMTANTISQNAHGYDEMDPQALHHHQLLLLHQQQQRTADMQRNRKRMPAPVKSQNNTRNSTPNKRIKREMEVMQPEMPREPTEKPDANMCLKFTFGVNAWKQWVATKNADLEKSSIRRKPIKSEILQLTADELNYSLCMFVKEVRKPNGSEYAPDTIYYLVLGIQQYLYENGRIDNIFTDRYYEQFTDCLDEVAKKFSVLYNDSQYIVTRVEEEHLWECKQLGAHSPHVLLSTLMFFNTKHFNLVTVDEHMELSFSHIMKHWKRNPNQPGAAKLPGSRNVLLRFYPPQSSLEANSRKKKVYEQQENEENPLRCPVKLYEFYLSKCPESVKTRNDVFYLQPERSCVPDSPVWYSTQALSREALSKMLHRVKMVKEINIALLTS